MQRAFLAALVLVPVFVSPVLADDLNPQPLPPGRHAATGMNEPHWVPPVRATEPPDPCMKSQTQIQAQGTGAGAGKVQTEPMMRKAGGTQTSVANTNVHCLNPQPLPPG